MQNQTIFESYADDEKTEYSSKPNDILQSAKKFYEKLFSEKKKISNEQFHLCETIISLKMYNLFFLSF